MKPARLVPVILSSLFLLMGLALLVPIFVIPMSEVVRAQRWVQAGCTIEDSRVASDGETYSVKVAYHYWGCWGQRSPSSWACGARGRRSP
jgi:Protein of unknown function (DUF3592)